jgi:phosphatidylglycerol:prolipoprotein diacylglycerol transferase
VDLPSLVAVVGWPVLDRIRLGPLAVSPHGIGIALGYLAGSWVMVREGKKRGIAEEHAGSILLWALIGAIVGARFFYVVGHFDEFDSFTEMLAIWRGGISLIGGITGAMIFAYPVMRRNGYRFLQVMDSAAVALALGIMVGRIGDLIIGDHLGKPTSFFLGWAYRGGNLPGPWFETGSGEWQATLPNDLIETFSREGARLLDGSGNILAQGPGVHQTALYDFLIAIGLFALLWWMNRSPRREGVLIMTFAIVYGAGRIVTDLLRVDKTWFGLTGSQWASIAAIAISLFVLLRYARRPLAGEKEADGVGEPDEDDEDWRTTLFVPPEEPGSTSPRERERP